MTHSFTKHPQLLAQDETLDQHATLRKEHRDAVLRDKDNKNHLNGGLFKGFFDYRFPRAPIRDSQDGVDRCPDCMWELEDGHCAQCNRYYGPLPDGANFSGFSEDGDGSDIYRQLEAFGDIIEVDGMEYDPEFEDAEDDEDWYDQVDQVDQFMDPTFSLRRYLGNAGPPSSNISTRNRRPAAHSAAGSHRRSLQDAASDMGSIAEEEEDEEEYEDDEDTSMEGFIVRGSSESRSQSSASASEQTPQPHSRAYSTPTEERGSSVTPGRRGLTRPSTQAGTQGTTTRPSQRRFQRVIEDTPEPTTSITSGMAAEEEVEEDDDDDDEMPIAGGMRRRASQQNQAHNARGRRSVSGQLGRNAGWGYSPLGVDGGDAFEEGDESDGTTVGLEPPTISNDRLRDGGSLTPTADRPHPPLRTPSRTGASGFPIGSRGLRRRSSVLSASNSHYEDNDADDDGTDVDVDGDTFMARHRPRRPSSRIRTNDNNVSNLAPISNGPTHIMTGEIDGEESDVSERPPRRRQNEHRQRSQEYNPRISLMFAEHQNEMRNVGQEEIGLDFESMQQIRAFARTPVARPRTANRNRQPIHGSVASPNANSPGTLPHQQPVGNSPGRLRTTAIDTEPQSNVDQSEERIGFARPVTAGGGSLLPSANTTSPFAVNRTIGESIQRPSSRVNFRSMVTATRWNPPEPPEAELLHGNYISPGLNPARAWQNQNRNPFYNTLRPRQSTQRLQNQPSTATLRARSSRIFRNQPYQTNGDSGNAPSSQVRPQASRIHLRAQPSVQRLQHQPSTRALRDPNPTTAPAPAHGPDRMRPLPVGSSHGDQRRRGVELVEQRWQELSQSQFVDTTTSNPFFRSQRQSSVGASSNGVSQQENPRATTLFRPMSGTATTHVTRESPVADIPARQTSGVTAFTLNANSPARRTNRTSGV